MKKMICMLLAACLVFAVVAFGTEPETTGETEISDWQNPVMNYIGEYQCGRAHALVECSGKEDARITIEWGGSAWETAQWDITGRLDPETMTVKYSDCTKQIITYGENGEVKGEETEFEDGTGTIVFNDDGTFTWHDEQSASETDMVFEWLPVEPSSQIANPWHDITEAEAEKICPKSFEVPEGAENVKWSVMEPAGASSDTQGTLVQLSFDLDGNSFTAREQVTGDPEADISGMYYNWTVQGEETLKNWAETVCHTFRWIGEDEYADLCAWYDAETGTSYSVSVTAEDLDGFDLLAIAEALHK